MAYTSEEILNEWLLGRQSNTYPLECVVHAFDCLEKHLGREWIEQESRGSRGDLFITPWLCFIGQTLLQLERHPNFPKILQKIRENTKVAISEATIAGFMHTNSCSVHVDPIVNGKKPDLLVSWNASPIYIEITIAEDSQYLRRVRKEMIILAKSIVKRIYVSVAIEVNLSIEIIELTSIQRDN